MDENGTARAIFPNIINYVTRQEGWKVEYIFLSFSEGLQKLTKGEIDLMSSVAFSAERTSKLAFCTETVMTTFARVYIRPESEINDLIDLSGKKIAVPKNGVLYVRPGGIRELLQAFHVPCTFVERDTFEQVMKAVADGAADAAVASRLIGNEFEDKYQFERSAIVFRPI